MKTYLRLLRERPLLWIVPIVALYGALFWLAWQTVQAPSAPWTYRL